MSAYLVKKLKEKDQDFEFYPTTREILEAMYWDLLPKRYGKSDYRADGKRYSILDIGAGNCKLQSVFKQIADEQPLLDEYFIHENGLKSYRNKRERNANKVFLKKYMAIEKSQILIDNMPDDVFIVGTEFHENTLIDKSSDIVFCNPPYSEYSQWTERIIKEANAKLIYLVIPKRWGNQDNIAYAIKQRRAKVSIVGDFDFLNSEDRAARAKVSLVKVDLRGKKFKTRTSYHQRDKQEVDPFDLWFNETFKIDADQKESSWRDDREKEEKQKEKIENAIVKGGDLVSTLVELYNKELNALILNYTKLSELDRDLLKELNVNVSSVLKAFKEKIVNLKNFYWHEIFDNLESITSRLTSRTRDKLLSTLTANTNIDFTIGNIRSVVIWVIKNANNYFNSQMLEVYDDFTTDAGIKLYKSNQRFNDDNFRYCKSDKKLEKYALDYRMVLHGYHDPYSYGSESFLSKNQMRYIQDIIIIANNLNFSINKDIGSLYIQEKESIYFNTNYKDKIFKVGTKTLDGKIQEVYCHTNIPNKNNERVLEKDGVLYVYDEKNKEIWYQYKINDSYVCSSQIVLNTDVFTTVRGYKNGNVHFQFNKEFIKKLNLEVGRLRGWIKKPQDAVNEFDISLEEANSYWESNYTLLPSDVSNLLPNHSKTEKPKELKIEDLESTSNFDASKWWQQSANLEELKEGDLLTLINECNFEVELENNKYHLIDKQEANLRDIDSERFDSLIDCCERLNNTYFSDYFGDKYDFNCKECNKIVSVNDEAYGDYLCDACSVFCESCNNYYTKKEGQVKNGTFICNDCILSDIKTLDEVLYKGEKEEVVLSNKYEKIIVSDGKTFFLKDIIQDVTEHYVATNDIKFNHLKRNKKMISKLAIELIKFHKSGDLYGGVKTSIVVDKKEEISTSYQAAFPLFDICDDYRNGLIDGLTVLLKRDADNFVTSIDLKTVQFEDKIPFNPIREYSNIPFEVVKEILQEEDEFLLYEMLIKYFDEQKDSIEENIQEEVKPIRANNIIESNSVKIGSQLAFAF